MERKVWQYTRPNKGRVSMVTEPIVMNPPRSFGSYPATQGTPHLQEQWDEPEEPTYSYDEDEWHEPSPPKRVIQPRGREAVRSYPTSRSRSESQGVRRGTMNPPERQETIRGKKVLPRDRPWVFTKKGAPTPNSNKRVNMINADEGGQTKVAVTVQSHA